MLRKTLAATIVGLALCGAAAAQIVDHTAIDAVSSLPQAVMDEIGQQRWLFTHASVGGNMVAGLGDLHASDPGRYQLVTSSVGFDSGQQQAADPPASTTPGTVYECQRGNPGWSAKLTIFDNSVRTAGWRQPSVDVAMDKLCYIDEDADPSVYTATLSALEGDFPATVFVYITMPLTTGEDSTNVQRNDYNDAVRGFCTANGSLLFDLADMEAHDPSGVEQTFQYGGLTYQKLYAGYTDDGGHLNVAGRQRIALGWYAVAATLTGGRLFSDGFENGTSAWSTVVP